MSQRTYRAKGYALLAEQLQRWQKLPTAELLSRIGGSAQNLQEHVDGDDIVLDISVSWADAKREAVRIHGVASGSNHLHIERLEESVIVRVVPVCSTKA